ncbi:type I-MYXAN CRISPR-associated protein Cas5/Cmx5/DevS [Chamaesiphon sp.]|uniref:type I-MYXAN CRISPR-associated protein Cas5/Cmx5/DevS n=1 Tax=Chamaesiphon sp. TaxID=2814140 RepID=UPI003593EBB9
MTINKIALQVEVPIACFRDSRAREYIATYPVPPPSTVYGMLLSTVGEENRFRHCGVKLAIAMRSETAKSRVIRKVRRFKVGDINSVKNSKPDYQELLTGIKFVVWIDATADKSSPNLAERLHQAMTDPSSVVRFGNICLGESRDLVNSIDIFIENSQQGSLTWLTQSEYGELTLPYWIDRLGSERTRWLRYKLIKSVNWEPPALSWTQIQTD